MVTLPIAFIGLVDAVETLIWQLDKRPPAGARDAPPLGAPRRGASLLEDYSPGVSVA